MLIKMLSEITKAIDFINEIEWIPLDPNENPEELDALRGFIIGLGG